MRSSNQSKSIVWPSKGLFHPGLLWAEPKDSDDGTYGDEGKKAEELRWRICVERGWGPPGKERRAYHEFLSQVLPELCGIRLFAVDSLHEESGVVQRCIPFYITSASLD